jgi:hypothetical protein
MPANVIARIHNTVMLASDLPSLTQLVPPLTIPVMIMTAMTSRPPPTTILIIMMMMYVATADANIAGV